MSSKVLRLAHRNGFSGLQEYTEPKPTPLPHELLIKVRNVVLNYRDIAIASSGYPMSVKDNVIPGSDAMGEVVQVGDGTAKDFKIGDKVVIAFNTATLHGPVKDHESSLGSMKDGVLAEYVAMPAAAVVKVPQEDAKLSDAEWASLVCTGTTVWNAFYGNVPLRPGQTVLLQGTGGVSLTGLLVAKAAGATTIITSSSDAKLELAKNKYGADYTINYKTTPNWGEEVQRITKGRGVDHLLENGGSGTIKQSIEAIAIGGVISLIGFLSRASQEEMPDITVLAMSKSCVVRGIGTGSVQQLEEVVQFAGAQNIRMPIDKTFEFGRAGVLKAYEYLASGQHVGKVSISF